MKRDLNYIQNRREAFLNEKSNHAILYHLAGGIVVRVSGAGNLYGDGVTGKGIMESVWAITKE